MRWLQTRRAAPPLKPRLFVWRSSCRLPPRSQAPHLNPSLQPADLLLVAAPARSALPCAPLPICTVTHSPRICGLNTAPHAHPCTSLGACLSSLYSSLLAHTDGPFPCQAPGALLIAEPTPPHAAACHIARSRTAAKPNSELSPVRCHTLVVARCCNTLQSTWRLRSYTHAWHAAVMPLVTLCRCVRISRRDFTTLNVLDARCKLVEGQLKRDVGSVELVKGMWQCGSDWAMVRWVEGDNTKGM